MAKSIKKHSIADERLTMDKIAGTEMLTVNAVSVDIHVMFREQSLKMLLQIHLPVVLLSIKAIGITNLWG